MAKVFQFTAPAAQAADFSFTADAPLTSGARQTLISGATGPVTADIAGSKDGAAPAALTGTISNPGASWVYVYSASAADLTVSRVLVVRVSDLAGAAYDDVTLVIYVSVNVSRLNLDSSAVPGQVPLLLTPNGTTRHTNLLDVAMGAEPVAITGAVGATRGAQAMLQDLWYRFLRKHKKTGSGSSGQVIVYKEDDVTPIATQTASKTGSEQVVEKAS